MLNKEVENLMEQPKVFEKDSMIAAYLLERENEHTIFSQKGFVCYKIEPGLIYITTIYTLPNYRQTGAASELADKVQEIAKQHSISMLIGSVDVSANNPDQSIKALHGYGFQISHQDGSVIYFKKEIA